jgi:hypothetical protein
VSLSAAPEEFFGLPLGNQDRDKDGAGAGDVRVGRGELGGSFDEVCFEASSDLDDGVVTPMLLVSESDGILARGRRFCRELPKIIEDGSGGLAGTQRVRHLSVAIPKQSRGVSNFLKKSRGSAGDFPASPSMRGGFPRYDRVGSLVGHKTKPRSWWARRLDHLVDVLCDVFGLL